ncbi:hypothetical protein ORV05_22640 [Amycolatopsis cynarae]|uniref:Uncharacterized protein n=1 Tax=Amycolatopsis cynarae TaxID=2995223 RepID=A0ABY7AV29_9PSEU|nr:hypothetical protein [Amycolatopsis sp. HUAS 11-8]WAL63786.1 hypothetical protein ORV05_22640 [Amycolatopsis sp. HUAS 11-8]
MAVLNLAIVAFILFGPRLAEMLVDSRDPVILTPFVFQTWFCAGVLMTLAALLLRTRWALARFPDCRSARHTRTTAFVLAGIAVVSEILIQLSAGTPIDLSALIFTLLLVFIAVVLRSGLARVLR